MPEAKKSKYNYYEFDTNKVPNMASFVIYGLLKDQLTKEEKDELFRKISIIDVMKTQFVTGFEDVYGRKIAEIAGDGDLDTKYMDATGPKYAMSSNTGFYKIPTTELDPALKVFKEGITELADIMKKKQAKMRFRTEAEKNYYDLMLVMMEDAANERNWRDNIETDIAYEYAWNTEIKFRFTAAIPVLSAENDDDKLRFGTFLNEMDDRAVLSVVAETGIPDAAAGGIRTIKKLEDHIRKGEIGRDELIREYEAQQARMEKALNISPEVFAKLESAHAVENNIDEFTNGARGYGYVLEDVIAKKDLLKAGWPASDIQNLAMFRRLISLVESKNRTEPSRYQSELDLLMRDIEAESQKNAVTDEEKAAKTKKEQALNAKKADLEQQKVQIDAAVGLTTELKQLWNELTDENGMTENERSTRLVKVRDFLEKAKDNMVFAGAAFVQTKVTGMIERELEPSEKALLSEDIAGFVRNLEAVDPTLVSSSKQFSSFKSSLKELNRLKRNLDPNDQEKVDRYKEKVKEAAEKAAVYLRYKIYQNKGPKKDKHTRSELEIKRVNTVDAILQGLKSLTVPGSDELIIPKKNEYRVYDAPASDGLLGEYTAQPKTNVYDKMMERYTGRGAVNGTSEKMKKAFAKALTAYMLKQENPDAPLNKKKAEKMFKTISRELRIAEMTDEQLRESLQSPEVFSEAIIKQRSRVYAPDNEAAYKSYIKDMKSIYKIMSPKSKGDIWYNKAYDCIKKLAHLPEDLDGVDKNKAFRLVEKLNQELVSCSRERMIRKTGIYLDQEFRGLFLAMHSLADNCTGTTGLVNDLLEEYNTLRGAKRAPNGGFYIEDQVYFDFGHYDSERLKYIVDAIPEKDHRRKLDKSIERKMFDEVKPFNPKEFRNDMKKIKADAEKTGGKKFKDEPVKSSEKHVEPKKPRHNSMI